MSLLFAVWREVGRHLVLAEAVDLIAPLLRSRLPVSGLRVLRVDLDRRRVDIAAEWSEGRMPAGPHPGVLTVDVVDALAEWASKGRALASREYGVLSDILGNPADSMTAAALLLLNGRAAGVLLLAAERGKAFTSEQLDLITQLAEPFSVALANDARLQEMARMREALEADRRALLTRLGRQDVVDAIVGAETGLRGVMENVMRVAPTDAPVLLLGETGTGKEVIARAIHAHSHRANGPVERVNCGAIPVNLVDSELFGHERGSFTGAIHTRKGWFERADGGTLFLDEIGELPLEAQVRLLRILQDGTFERVGGQKTLRVDVRIIAATHRDLAEMVAEGTFRRDLWYRLNIFPIYLPPLRERPQDIPTLAAHFAWRVGQRLGRGALHLTREDIELLVRYDWPGNVRELAAVIERAAILGSGDRLAVAQALGPIEGVASSTPKSSGASVNPDTFPTLDQAMADHIRRALAATQGRIEGERGAGRLLGINPHTLRARMRKLGIRWEEYRRSKGTKALAGRAG